MCMQKKEKYYNKIKQINQESIVALEQSNQKMYDEKIDQLKKYILSELNESDELTKEEKIEILIWTKELNEKREKKTKEKMVTFRKILLNEQKKQDAISGYRW